MLLTLLSTLSLYAHATCGLALGKTFFGRIAPPAAALESSGLTKEQLTLRLERAFILFLLHEFKPVSEWLSRPVDVRFNRTVYRATLHDDRLNLSTRKGGRVLYVWPVSDIEELELGRAARFDEQSLITTKLFAPREAVPALGALLKMRRGRDRNFIQSQLDARDEYLRHLSAL